MTAIDREKLLRQRIREALGGRPKAGKAGIPRSTIEGWINGPTLPKLGQFLEFCDEVGREPSWFFGEARGSDDVHVPKLDIRAAAGGGAVNGLHSDEETLDFPRWMIDRLGGNKGRLALMRVHGDSMEPLIRNGALLLVDAADREYEKTKKPASPWHHTDIFVFLQDDELRVKRLLVDRKGAIVALSENPAYLPEVLRKQDFKMQGRVVWWDNFL